MKKTIKKIGFGLAITSFVIVSVTNCRKIKDENENTIASNELDKKINKKLKTECYIDGNLVPFSELNIDDNDSYVCLTQKKNNGELINIIEVFSSKEGYILYGKKHNLKLEQLLNFEDAMRTYVEKNDIENKFLTSGKLPKSYVDFESKTYQKYFGIPSQQKSLLTALHKNYYGGPDRLVGTTSPFLWGGWNNKVSSFTPLGVWGFTTLYDKKFYKNRMATIWGVGMSRVYFWGGYSFLNDRTTSVITG